MSRMAGAGRKGEGKAFFAEQCSGVQDAGAGRKGEMNELIGAVFKAGHVGRRAFGEVQIDRELTFRAIASFECVGYGSWQAAAGCG